MAYTKKKPSDREVEFFARLRALLKEFDVDIDIVDEGIQYGNPTPFVRFEFNAEYGVYNFSRISSADEPGEDGACKVS